MCTCDHKPWVYAYKLVLRHQQRSTFHGKHETGWHRSNGEKVPLVKRRIPTHCLLTNSLHGTTTSMCTYYKLGTFFPYTHTLFSKFLGRNVLIAAQRKRIRFVFSKQLRSKMCPPAKLGTVTLNPIGLQYTGEPTWQGLAYRSQAQFHWDSRLFPQRSY